MGRKRHGAARTPFILRLPPHLLRRIFLDPVKPIKLENLTICRALLAYTLQALYSYVDLIDPGAPARFARCTRGRREVLGLVKICSYCADPNPDTISLGDLDSKLVENVERDAVAEALYAMSNLEILIVRGKEAARRLFLDPLYLLMQPWPLLSAVTMVENHDYPGEWSDADAAILPRIARLPSLVVVAYSTISPQPSSLPPLPTLNSNPVLYMPQRSLSLRSIVLSAWQSTAVPDYRPLYAALRDCLDTFTLALAALPRSSIEHFTYLPPSIRTLVLDIGYRCPDGDRNSKLSFYAIDGVFSSFPFLERLTIAGNVLDDASALSTLNHLAHLTLGPHTFFLPSQLATLLPPTLPALKSLILHLCSCPTEPDGSRTVFSFVDRPCGRGPVRLVREELKRDTEDLLRQSERVGIVVDGTLRCGIAMCRSGEVHGRYCEGYGI
ncbi:hypothetical protein JCM8097_003455 [Rhodosporidiobolus ruineniae]